MAERADITVRIGKFVEINPRTGCWEWTGYRCRDGYGQIKVDGRKISAHRVTYALFVGELIDGMHIDHVCRNRACCNPAHLEQVTPEENVRRGLVAVLNVVNVSIIKTRLVDGDTPRDLAEDFGVSPSSIRRIASGDSWADVLPVHESWVA